MKKLLFLLFFVFVSANAYSLSEVKKTVCESGCDYTTVNDAVTYFETNYANFVTSDIYGTIEISGEWVNPDTTSVGISGLTTSETQNLTLITAGDARHSGVWSDTAYRLVPAAGDYGISVGSNNVYLVIDGLQISTSAASWAARPSAISANYIPKATIKNCILKGTGTGSGNVDGGSGIKSGLVTTGGTISIYNNIIYDFNKIGTGTTGYGINLLQLSGTASVYNNTVYGCEIGINVGNSQAATLKNNLANGNSVDYSVLGTTTTEKNISEDDTSPDTAYQEIAVTFLDEGSDNFTLPSGSEAIGIGIALNSIFTTDITDKTRGGFWDIGAFQYETTPYVPRTTSFVIPSFSRNLEIDITTWDTEVDAGEIVGYLLNESATTPSVDDEDWVAEEPSTYTFDSNGEKTLYAWLKSGNNEISSVASDTTEIRALTGLAYAMWANNGDEKIRQDEVRNLDEETTINEIWDGTTIRIKEGTNAFAQFSVYIEAGENTLTDISVEMSNLVNGENVIEYGTRTTSQLFNFTLTDIEIFYTRYLKIRGLYDSYDVIHTSERRQPEVMQRPFTDTWVNSTLYPPGYYKAVPNIGTVWEDREGADKYFPDILVPIELEPTFDIETGTSQQIWVDVWIAKDTPAGTYTGTFTIKDGGETLKTIPVELEVYNFELPDTHYMKTWTYLGFPDVIDRWMGERYPPYSSQSEENKNKMVEVWRYTNFILKRHGIYSNYGDTRTYCKDEFTDTVPSTGWIDTYKLLTGSLFSTDLGYNGPGILSPAEIYVIGMYGGWNTTTSFAGIFPATIESFTGTGTNNLTASNYTTGNVTPEDMDYVVQIDSASETFKWSNDGGETWEATGIAISTDGYELDEYTDIDWGGTTGHVNGDKWEWSSISDAEAAVLLQDVLDACYVNLEAVSPGIKKILYTYDEPHATASLWDIVVKACNWKNGSTGGGENIEAWTTGALVYDIFLGYNVLDIAMNNGLLRDNFNRMATDEYMYGYKHYEDIWKSQGKEIHRYTGPWNTAANATRIGWQLFKDDIEWNFLWASALWINNEGGYQYWNEKTDLFTQASTLGPTPPTNYSEEYGWETKGNGNGVLIYPGTDVYYKEFTFDANSGTLGEFSACTTDAGETTALCVKQDNTTNKLRAWVRTGSFDDNDVITDGTSTVTLTADWNYPDTNYGVNGPFASIRLKNYRKTVQDYDYLYMASQVCDSCVDSIVSGLGFALLNDVPVDWSNLGTGYGSGYGWSTYTIDYGSIDDFERARAKLANIILGTTPPSEFKGSLTGFSK